MTLPNPKMNLMTTAASGGLLRASMTPAERARGRFMRAPDHDAGAAGTSGDGGAGDGVDASKGGEQTDGAQDAGTDDTTVLGGAGEGSEGQEGEKDKGEGAEGDGQADAPAGAPDAYDLKPPEGMEFDQAAFEAAEPVLRELGLSNDQAQKLVSAYGEKIVPQIMERAQAQLMQGAATQRREWADAFEADPEFGGANKTRTQTEAARAFDHYGLKKGEGLRQLLDESGIGNHPDMIKFVARVGRDLGEGTFERGDTVTTPKSPEQKLYSDAFQPKK